MGLIDPAEGKGLDDPLVGPLHGQSVPFVKGAFMLIDQDTAIMKGLVAAAVKFLSKQPFPRPEGVDVYKRQAPYCPQ